MTEIIKRTKSEPKVKATGVALGQQDFDDIERIRQHFDLENFSQTVRRAIRIAVRAIETNESEGSTVDAA